jgi:peptide-methionine (S)-S-oxide reductase
VGYCGGTISNPTYDYIGDYSETVQVDYNPSLISYEQLLEAFWSGQDTSYAQYSRQYRSAIFYSSEEQRQAAIESRQREELRQGRPVFSDIEAITEFYIAEDYHQKYYLTQSTELLTEMSAIYPNLKDFINSPAVAKLNGYVAGYGDQAILQEQINRLGLSETGKQRLLKITASGLIPGCPVQIQEK